jgi:hypothetical protein
VTSTLILPVYTCYRYYNRAGRLLYIGSTYLPNHRRRYHRRHSPWWPQVDHRRDRIRLHLTAGECQADEQHGWDHEHPLHNKIRPTYSGELGPRGPRGPRSVPSPGFLHVEDFRVTYARKLNLKLGPIESIASPRKLTKPLPPGWTPRFGPSVHDQHPELWRYRPENPEAYAEEMKRSRPKRPRAPRVRPELP